MGRLSLNKQKESCDTVNLQHDSFAGNTKGMFIHQLGYLENHNDSSMNYNEPSSIAKNPGSQMLCIDNVASDFMSMKSFDSCSTKKGSKLFATKDLK